LKSLTTKFERYGQIIESESQIKNEIIQQKPVREGIENEIGCPRCYDVMMLYSNFDNLFYLCDSCDFRLYTIKR
jgi:uncharacterized protein (DUF983 family)